MKALIIANGKASRRSFYVPLIQGADIIIAADGGADNCIRLGIIPDAVVGDMDSISKKAKEKFKDILHKDPDQDTTDVMKALAFAKKKGADDITLTATLGTRLDHSLANILSIQGYPARILDEHNEIFITKRSIALKGKKGEILSIIALAETEHLSYDGLKYPVKNIDVPSGWMGTSNEFTKGKAKVTFSKGLLLIMRARD